MKGFSPSGHAVFKISERANESLDNPFFAAFENQISDALIGNGLSENFSISENYVCNRMTTVPESVIDALRARLPTDIIDALERQIADGDLSYAYYEMDLINFLINSNSNKVLSIVGSVGIGKSTYIDFIFHHLRLSCASLKLFLPIKFDGLLIGDSQPNFSEILQRLHIDTISVLKREFSGCEGDRYVSSIKDFYSEIMASSKNIKISSTVIIEYFNLLKRTIGYSMKPVLIFDNLDQMTPVAVAKFSHLARGIYLNTDFTIIMCMRPPTFATHVEVDANKGAFYTFRINLPCPDIHNILNKRLKSVFKNNTVVKIEDPKTGFRLAINNPFDVIDNLNKNILTPSNNELLVQGVSCNNVRKALAAFYNYLRYSELDFRKLFNVKIEGSYAKQNHIRKHDWSEHFLTGLILGGSKYYNYRKGSTIYNLLYSEEAGYDLDYCIKYRIITIFYHHKKLISISKATQLLSKLGYEQTFTKKVIEDLLKNYILVSPEHEFELRHVEYASISVSGIYYYENFIDNHKYLYELIYDVPLNHLNWERDSSQEFEVRAMSVIEYLGRVILLERDHINRIRRNTDTSQICSILKSTGFLCRKILKSAEDMASIGKKATSKHVSMVANTFEIQLAEVRDNVDSLELQLDESLKSRSYIGADTPIEKEETFLLGNFGQLTVKYPEKLEPSGENIFKTELLLEFEKEPDSLVVWLESSVPIEMKPSRICTLDRKDKDSYYGEILLDNIPSILSFPKSSITILSDCRPILTRELKL